MNWFFLFLAAGILFWFIILFYLKSYIKRRTGSDYTLENLREEIRLLEADIDAKTEQNLALLEEKIGELRRLCTEAEKRVAVYARELSRRIAEEEAFTALGQTPPELSSAPPSGKMPVSPASAGRREKSPRKKAQTSGNEVSGKRDPGGKKTPGPRKVSSLLDSIEVRELTAARAAGAYRTGARRPAMRDEPAGSSVPHDGTERVPAAPEARLPPEGRLPVEGRLLPEGMAPTEAPREDGLPPESGSPPARFVASPNPIRAKAPPMKERVAELYRAGFSEDLVAARLGISVTEARLYIAMASSGRPEH
jgi:hypothetical protein